MSAKWYPFCSSLHVFCASSQIVKLRGLICHFSWGIHFVIKVLDITLIKRCGTKAGIFWKNQINSMTPCRIPISTATHNRSRWRILSLGVLTYLNWNENVIILMKFSSLTALEVVILTTSSAVSDENFIKMLTSPLQCICPMWNRGWVGLVKSHMAKFSGVVGVAPMPSVLPHFLLVLTMDKINLSTNGPVLLTWINFNPSMDK